MTNEQKKQVRDALVRYAASFPTQNEAAESLQGVSASTISLVKNNNWELLSERLWHHIARQVGFYGGEWQPADTSAYLLLRILFGDAQHYNMMYGISIGKGLGKTFTAAHYTRENPGTCYNISGSEHYNRKSFIMALAIAAGVTRRGSVPTLLESITEHIAAQEEPLLIIDDAHRLKDRVLHLLVLLANELAGKAGIIIMGDDTLRWRIIEGMRMKKPGYDQIYQAIGRRFITLTTLAPRDVALVCHANGVHDDELIAHITAECDNDLHNAASLITQHTNIPIAA
jgi:hypothetical protein